MEHRLCFLSPAGPLTLAERDGALVGLRFEAEEDTAPSPLLLRAREELEEYFAGRRREFDLPLSPHGTPFQRQVWQALRTIPYGSTCTYGQLAAAVGNPRAARAVGMANHRNPLPILIPCHRVIGSTGSLTGYAGGVERKRLLLSIEEPIL